MTINYKGSYENQFNHNKMGRLAEINCSEDEQVLFDRMAKLLAIHGWNLDNCVEGYACVEVMDRDEYNEFVEEYKAAKKTIRNHMKFGF